MARSILSYLAIASTVSLIATITLLTTSSSLKSLTKSPQSIGDLGYLPPAALRRQNETNHDVGLGRALERSPSEPLSSKRNTNSSSEIIVEIIQQSEQANNNNSGTQQKQQQQQLLLQPEPQQQQPQNELQQQRQTEQTQKQTQHQTPPPPQTNSDKRPSGVIYQYIPPTPINLTARALLPLQFPHLASPSLDNFNSNTSTPTAALCAIVKDSEPYLDEWTDYHIGLGFHTLILIDNSPHHELLPWQIRRRSAGHSVRVLPKPGTHRQMYGYHMCAAEFKDDFTYMAFLDVDEFLVLKKHDTVTEMLAEHLERGALGISWFIFGSGGRKMYGPWPVTKRFVYRDGLGEGERHRSHWHYVKSVVKLSDYGGYPKSPHSMKTDRGRTGSEKAWVDTNGKGNFDSIGASNYDRPVDVAVIHHYKYLSPKEYRWKTCVRKTVDDKVKDCQEKLERGMSPFDGTVFDDSAWQTLKKNVPKYAMYDQFEDFM